MAGYPFATYVFIDVGAPGLREDNPQPIVAISLLAVRSEDFRNINDQNRKEMIERPPIVADIHCHGQELEFGPRGVIEKFIKPLSKPVCLIAYSGFNYDFPVLKSTLSYSEESFLNDIACADSMAAVYDITWPSSQEAASTQLNKEFRPSSLMSTREERRLGAYPWPGWYFDKPSYSLSEVCERELQQSPYPQANTRNLAALRVAVKFSEKFSIWLENKNNYFQLSEVPYYRKHDAISLCDPSKEKCPVKKEFE